MDSLVRRDGVDYACRLRGDNGIMANFPFKKGVMEEGIATLSQPNDPTYNVGGGDDRSSFSKFTFDDFIAQREMEDDFGYNIGKTWMDPPTSADEPSSWFQSGVAPYVLHDIAYQQGDPETQAYADSIDWRNITHPQSYKMRDEITDPLYRIFNPRQGYTGVGGNIRGLGWDLYQDIDDERTHADLSLGIPLWGGNLRGGVNWNSEDDITRALINFSLPFGGQ